MPTKTETTLEESLAHGTLDNAVFFRETLKEIGETQSGLARLMKQKGDERQPATILRTSSAWRLARRACPGR